MASLREAFLVAMHAPAGGMSDRAAARAAEVAEALGPASLTRGLEAVGTALVEMRQAPDPRIPLEVALVRLTRPDTADDLTALTARIEQLERALGAGPSGAPVAPAAVETTPPSTASPELVPPETAPAETVPPESAAPPTAPPSGSRRGAAAARAELARQHSPAPPPEPSTSAGAGSRPSLGGVRRAREGTESADPTGDVPDVPEVPDAPAPATTPADGGDPGGAPPTLDELVAGWETVLGGLKPRAKALYKPGRFVSLEGGTARFVLPNQAHCDRCLDKRDEVAAALRQHFGRPVPLELVVDDTEPPSSPAATATAGGTPSDPPAAADEVDLDELTDAPDATVGGIAQLKDAFPGAELEDR